MRGKFSNYSEHGITTVSEAVELAKLMLHKVKKLCMDVEFMFERYFNQQSEDGYEAEYNRTVEFYETLAEIGKLRPDGGNSNAAVGHVAGQGVFYGLDAIEKDKELSKNKNPNIVVGYEAGSEATEMIERIHDLAARLLPEEEEAQ